MSKIYTFILMLFISIAAFAADRPRTSRLTITTSDNADIRVEIDGRRYREGDNDIRINNINPGYHSIKVFRTQSSGMFGRNREKVVYQSNVYLKPEFQVDIWIDRNGRAQVKEYDLNRRDDRRDNDRNRRNDRNDNGGWGNDRNDRDNGRWDDYDEWNKNGGYDNRNDDWSNGKYNTGRAVSYQTFESMKQSLRRENFENTRVNLAKQMLERNAFETSQVKEMLQLFSFESNRLELAKLAYRNTTDKRSYYSINDVFSYSTSRDELNRYINNYR